MPVDPVFCPNCYKVAEVTAYAMTAIVTAEIAARYMMSPSHGAQLKTVAFASAIGNMLYHSENYQKFFTKGGAEHVVEYAVEWLGNTTSTMLDIIPTGVHFEQLWNA